MAPRRTLTASAAHGGHGQFKHPVDALNVSGKRRRHLDTTSTTNSSLQAVHKPPLPPPKKDSTRCCSVDRILDSPVKKSARLLDGVGVEGIPEQSQRKTKSVDDLLDNPPTIAITDHSNDEQSQSPTPERDSDTNVTTNSTTTVTPVLEQPTSTSTSESCSLSKECPAHPNRSRRSQSVLSDASNQSNDSSSDPNKRKHFLGKYVRRMKDILKK